MQIRVKVEVTIGKDALVIDDHYGYVGSVDGITDQVLADIKGKLDAIYGKPEFKKLDDITVKKDKSIGIRKEG